uniref:hypothetical protein n=1 Tax=Candidatus Cryptobacteroides bacterium TaxID=3085639 RepID=UPI004026ACB2
CFRGVTADDLATLPVKPSSGYSSSSSAKPPGNAPVASCFRGVTADDLATLPVKPSAEYSSSSSAKPPGNAPVAVQLILDGSHANICV